ncbi:MAG TPA: COR domain-containing protein, partial [Blastocatellia bacterium]
MTLKSDTHDALAKTETLIEKARKNRSRKLSLADKGLSELPDSLFELSQLERLSLSGNQLTELPESIGQLKGLEALDVSSNRLVSLPESIGELTALRNLNLADNQLREVPDSVGALIALRSLFIYNNNLRRLPYGIGRCIALHTLHIAGNHLDSLPDSIGDLKSLKTLGVSHNELREVPASIGSLKSLSRLNLNYNPLTELPASVTSLESLTSLYVESTQIRELPKAICKLISLRVLSVSDNHLTGLPVAIGSLSSLKGLYLQNNRLTDLPQGLRTLASLSDLFLHGNPGLELPPEVLGPMHGDRDGNNKPANPADILDYYFRTKAGRRPLNEAKLVLVGRGGVGKTSVVNRLARDRFDPNEKKTEGIKITDWEFGLRDGEQARLNIWDFGGQEIMHATHQFFLTERSLYLLVVSGREGGEDADAEYWLRLIESFGGDSPVIVVLNKIKDHPFDLNRGALKQKYPRIRGFIKTDCKAGTGCDELRNTVMTETDRLEHLRDPFPAAWFAIKDKLASTKRNYLSFEEYRRLCAKLGEKDESAQEALAGYLNSLGIALNYKDDPRLKDMHILNPHWVTGGVYRILNSPTLESQKGEIRLDDLSRILGKTKYPASMHRFLLDLMKKFELCFNFPEDDSCFLIPELLDKQQPAEAEQFQPEDCLNFEYHYPVLPEGLLPRFIVRSHGLTAESTRWRTGAILKFEGCEALVKADVETKKVCIHIRAGRPESQRRLLAVIRSDFERI